MRSSASSLALILCLAGCFAPNPADRLYTCASSSQCPSGYDCAEGYCFRHGHTPTMSDACNDHQQDGDETGVDCGGPTCPFRCANGGMCAAGSDCDSAICNLVTNVCVASSCEDGMRDDAETDVDCGGGTCPKCADGKACTTPGDCNSLLCNRTSHLCVADPCFDGTKDQSETDVDCGGLCQAKCKNNQGCNNVNDCVAGATCTGAKCQVPRCVDNMKNFDETDIDCGGATCGGCPDGKACLVGSDCASTYCNVQTHLCVPTQCQDGAKDGSESDVDCGGPDCNKCPDGKGCSGGSDCVSGSICTFDKLCCHPNGMACTGAACGTATDNCGQTFNCGNNGACTDPTKPYCKGNCCSALKDQATTCAGKQCGTISDGCGNNYTCGPGCSGGYSCSGAPSYQCCPDTATACLGHAPCSQVSISCNGQTLTVTCPCAAGDVCYNGACCTPNCAGVDPNDCFRISDGCGGYCPYTPCTGSGYRCCVDYGCIHVTKCPIIM